MNNTMEEKREELGKNYIPLYIDFSGLKVLVVGGGSLGTRRALMFKKAGAKVIVVAKEFSEELRNAKDIELREVRLPEELDIVIELVKGSDIVVIALSDENIASVIAGKAMAMGKLVNNGVNSREGNVIVPFQSKVLELGVSVTSFGLTGLAARIALEKFVKLLREDREVEAALKAMGRLKKIIKSSVVNPGDRMRLYEEIHSDKEFREYLRKGDWISAYLRGLRILELNNITLNPSYYIILNQI